MSLAGAKVWKCDPIAMICCQTFYSCMMKRYNIVSCPDPASQKASFWEAGSGHETSVCASRDPTPPMRKSHLLMRTAKPKGVCVFIWSFVAVTLCTFAEEVAATITLRT